MKTAISLPDALFEQMDALAAKLHINRSQLYVRALERYLKEYQDNRVTELINEYIDEHGQPTDPVVLKRTLKNFRKVEW
jgi:predicted transcriptional regulator